MGNNRVYIEWLNSCIMSEKSYHNHKETMAWVATALYLPTITGIGYFISTNNLSCTTKLVMTIVIFVIFIVFLCLFIGVQLTERWKAAERVTILTKYYTELLLGKLTLDEINQQTIEVDGVFYPKRIADEINEGYKHRYCNLDTRLKTEIATYIMIVVATAIAIFLILGN